MRSTHLARTVRCYAVWCVCCECNSKQKQNGNTTKPRNNVSLSTNAVNIPRDIHCFKTIQDSQCIVRSNHSDIEIVFFLSMYNVAVTQTLLQEHSFKYGYARRGEREPFHQHLYMHAMRMSVTRAFIQNLSYT